MLNVPCCYFFPGILSCVDDPTSGRSWWRSSSVTLVMRLRLRSEKSNRKKIKKTDAKKNRCPLAKHHPLQFKWSTSRELPQLPHRLITLLQPAPQLPPPFTLLLQFPGCRCRSPPQELSREPPSCSWLPSPSLPEDRHHPPLLGHTFLETRWSTVSFTSRRFS